MVGVSASTYVTMSFTGSIGSGTWWAPGCPLLPVPRGGSDATMSGRESGDGDSSPTLVGWFLDIVVSLAGRWFEGWFPPAFVDRLTGEEHSWFGRFNLMRSSPDGGLLSIDNGEASSSSLTDVAAVLGEPLACVSCLDVRELIVDTCEFAYLGSKTLETLGEMAEKGYGLVCYTLWVSFLGKAIVSNAV